MRLAEKLSLSQAEDDHGSEFRDEAPAKVLLAVRQHQAEILAARTHQTEYLPRRAMSKPHRSRESPPSLLARSMSLGALNLESPSPWRASISVPTRDCASYCSGDELVFVRADRSRRPPRRLFGLAIRRAPHKRERHTRQHAEWLASGSLSLPTGPSLLTLLRQRRSSGFSSDGLDDRRRKDSRLAAEHSLFADWDFTDAIAPAPLSDTASSPASDSSSSSPVMTSAHLVDCGVLLELGLESAKTPPRSRSLPAIPRLPAGFPPSQLPAGAAGVRLLESSRPAENYQTLPRCVSVILQGDDDVDMDLPAYTSTWPRNGQTGRSATLLSVSRGIASYAL